MSVCRQANLSQMTSMLLGLSLGLVAALYPLAPATADDNASFGVRNTSEAAPTGSPVEIESCEAGEDAGSGLLIAKSDRQFNVSFTNEGNVTADIVRFRLTFGDEQFYIRDKGVFSPGVTINHKYKKRGGNVFSSPLFGHTKLTCEVVAVHFTDGKDWAIESTSSTTDDTTSSPAPKTFGVMLHQTSEGIKITNVIAGSAAEAAGLRGGDVLKTVQGQAVSTVTDAVSAIHAAEAEGEFTITVMRDGKLVNVTASSQATSAAI